MKKNQESKIIITMVDCGEAITYEKGFEESIDAVKLFEAYLRAYETFGYMNPIGVTIDNSMFGESYVEYDPNIGIVTDCALNRYLDNHE